MSAESRRADRWLGIGAVLGLAAIAVIVPSQHPDRHAPDASEPQKVESAARTYLDHISVDVSDLSAETQLRRQPNIYRAMVRHLARTGAAGRMAAGEWPAKGVYLWRIRFLKGTSERHVVQVGADGRVWSVRLASDHLTSGLADRGALLAAVPEMDSLLVDGLDSVSDSMLHFVARFSLNGSGRVRPEAAPGLGGTREALRRFGRIDPDATVAMARHHLGRTVHGDRSWSVDSIYASVGTERAVVRFSAPLDLGPAVFRAEVELAADGRLFRLQTSIPEESLTSTPSTVELVGVTTVQIGLILLLIMILLVAFVRRLIARTVDPQSALLDGIVLGTVVALSLVLSTDQFGDVEELWQRILLMVLTFSVVGGVFSLVGFVLSGIMESFTREAWSQKLTSITLVRRGDVYNRLVGDAIVRGFALALALIGVSLVAMMVVPHLPFDTPEALISDSARQATVRAVTTAAGSALVTVMILLSVASFVRRRLKSAWVVLLSVAALGMAGAAGPLGFPAEYGRLPVMLASSAVLGMALIRYDFLTVLTGAFIAGLIVNIAEGGLISGHPGFSDTVFGGSVVLAMVGFGLVASRSARSGRERGEFVPAYIQQMASDERIKHELNIARQIQASFLPRDMPRLDTLEVAALCEPAQEVGGDYYDLVRLDADRLAVLVGDVSGKGFQAAFFMTLAKGILQTLAIEPLGPSELLQRFNRVFHANVPARTFISLAYGILDLRRGTFTFARAGHNPLIHRVAATGEAIMVCPPGMAVGFDSGPKFDHAIEQVTLTLAPNDVVVLYTDGLSEAMSPSRDLYGDDRLRAAVAEHVTSSAEHGIRHLVDDVRKFMSTAPQHDDMTVMVLRYLGSNE